MNKIPINQLLLFHPRNRGGTFVSSIRSKYSSAISIILIMNCECETIKCVVEIECENGMRQSCDGEQRKLIKSTKMCARSNGIFHIMSNADS